MMPAEVDNRVTSSIDSGSCSSSEVITSTSSIIATNSMIPLPTISCPPTTSSTTCAVPSIQVDAIQSAISNAALSTAMAISGPTEEISTEILENDVRNAMLPSSTMKNLVKTRKINIVESTPA